MKGHMEDGKFHPHTQTKGVRKSRDQQAKTEGVKVERKKRFPPFITSEEAGKFSDADIERKINIHQNAVSQQGKDLAQGHGFDKDEHEATINALNLLVGERAIRNMKKQHRKARSGLLPKTTGFGQPISEFGFPSTDRIVEEVRSSSPKELSRLSFETLGNYSEELLANKNMMGWNHFAGAEGKEMMDLREKISLAWRIKERES